MRRERGSTELPDLSLVPALPFVWKQMAWLQCWWVRPETTAVVHHTPPPLTYMHTPLHIVTGHFYKQTLLLVTFTDSVTGHFYKQTLLLVTFTSRLTVTGHFYLGDRKILKQLHKGIVQLVSHENYTNETKGSRKEHATHSHIAHSPIWFFLRLKLVHQQHLSCHPSHDSPPLVMASSGRACCLVTRCFVSVVMTLHSHWTVVNRVAAVGYFAGGPVAETAPFFLDHAFCWNRTLSVKWKWKPLGSG